MPIFHSMYGFRGTSSPIREAAPRYGARTEPDRFPADEVLADLERAAGVDAPVRITRILARYAALRHWRLRVAGSPEPVTEHAGRAARAYLAASLGRGPAAGVERWTEGSLLLRLLDSRPDHAGAVLAAAADEARSVGDERGASALRAAAREASLLALRSGRQPPAP